MSIWIALGIDPLAETVLVLAVSLTREEAEALASDELRREEDVTAWRVFDISKQQSPQEIYNWLRSCKLTPDDAQQAVSSLNDVIRKELTEA